MPYSGDSDNADRTPKHHVTLGLLRHLGKYTVIAVVLVVFYSHTVITTESSPRVHTSIDRLPYNKVALLLGTSPYLSGGRLNSYFWNRVHAAATLFREGKVSYILASGDNRHGPYNEPKEMQEALQSFGVPSERIILDYAGYSTFDSVLRTREIFLQSSVTVVSQQFHAERALYIAAHRGVDAVAYVARDVKGAKGVPTRFREYFARVKALVDVHVRKQGPEYPGEAIPIP